MDYFKRLTVEGFTAWDLNCPEVYKPHNRKKNKQTLKRSARRKEKQSFKDSFEKALDEQEERN